MIYFKNKKNLDTFLMVFVLGAVKAYRRNYIDLTILEYYIFSMSIRLMCRKAHLSDKLLNIIGDGMSLEDVDEWMARRIPIPALNDTLDDIEYSSWIALIERELERDTLSEALKISTHDENKLGIYFFTDYVEEIFWALFLLGLYEVLQKPEFISESILSCIKQSYLSEIYTCKRIQNEDFQACISNLQEIADTNISGQLSKDLIIMKAKLASLQVLLPFYDVSFDKLKTDIDLKVPEAIDKYPENRMFGTILPASGFYVRHVNGIAFNNIKMTTTNKDERPMFHLNDVKNFTQQGCTLNNAKVTLKKE